MAAASCGEVTALRLVISTNVPYTPNSRVAIYAASGKEVEVIGAQALQDAWGPDGLVGTLTVVPASDGVTSAAVRVVLGVGRDPDTCRLGATQTEGCIVARRQLSFVRRNTLDVPVRLHAVCNGQLCDADTTCNALGACVSAKIDANKCAEPGGCEIEGDGPFGPGGDAGADSGLLEASTDAAPDTSTEAGAGDSGADGSSDAGDTGAPGEPVLMVGQNNTCLRFTPASAGTKCWGANQGGQLGLGDNNPVGLMPGQMGAALAFLDLGPGRHAEQMSLRYHHACARLDDGRVKCWGPNTYGGLGLGDTASRGDQVGQMGANLPFVDLGPGRTAKDVQAGNDATCAVIDDGSLRCWGTNGYLVLGVGDPPPTRGAVAGEMGSNLPAVSLGTGRTVKAIRMGSSIACALLDNNSVKCWGVGRHLGLGDTLARGGAGTMGDDLPALDFGPGRTVKSLALGDLHGCVILDNDVLKCWGWNNNGQLGLGDFDTRGELPGQMGTNLPAIDLGPGRNARSVAAGAYNTCAILDNGDLKCWGYAQTGVVGLGDTTQRGSAPGQMGANLPAIDLGPGRTARQVALGATHACALLDNGELKCWGESIYGAPGLGDAVVRGNAPGQMGANLPAVQVK